MPIFYFLRRNNLSFVHGFVWGMVAFGFHFSAIAMVCIEYGIGWFKFIAPLIPLIWFALWSGIWFWFLSLKNNSFWYLIVSSFFFLFIHYIILFPFFCEFSGYPFVFPLIPLMYGNMARCVSLIGKEGLLLGLIGFQLTFAYQRWNSALVLFLFLFSNCLVTKKQEYKWQEPFQTIACKWTQHNPYERAQEICHLLIEARVKHPQKRVFVLPESSFPFPLHEHKHALKMWTANALFDDKYLILGSHRREGKKLFNTFYIVYKGRIIFYYDKRHLVPFFETPHRFKKIFEKGNTLFLHKKESFTRSLVPPKTFSAASLDDFTPLICSEIFWTTSYQKRRIALVNDAYFSSAYFPLVMRVLAQLNAFENDSNLLYCSYRSNFKELI